MSQEYTEPSILAIEIKERLLHLNPDEIDLDANGGFALWFYYPDYSSLMLGIRNNGKIVRTTYDIDDRILFCDVFSNLNEFEQESEKSIKIKIYE
jgi:hypothetical protein